ncbi:hypothetical protein [Carnobacterium pleistocenium]|uniref:hypothetical protein n=1 Tax=Carnobacterium pleistocenium TaxID=181073 RepID=UPI000557973C|nr:hypothetical protein [Carnobacterium pleistocenium]
MNQHLDFKNLVKYRIKVTLGNDYKNLGQTGNTGFTISPDVGATVYYPDIGRVSDAYSVYINPTSSDGGYLRAKVRKIAGRNQIYDSDISKNGGFTTISTDRLVIPMGEVREFILEISTSSIKLMINNVLYLDVNEDLSWLTNNPCRLSLWGSNFDLNSTSVEHSFDNLLIEEVK